MLFVQLQFLATEEANWRHTSKFLSWHAIWHICLNLFDCEKNVNFFEFAKCDWLYPNVGLPFTGERLCWSVRGKKEDRGPDLLLPSTASFLLLFRHNCSFQRSFYSTLIDSQWSPTNLVTKFVSKQDHQRLRYHLTLDLITSKVG